MKNGVSMDSKGRAPIVAGLFYPEDKLAVEEQLRSFGLKDGAGSHAQAIIAPHGAWDISGAIAGKAFAAAAGRGKPQGDLPPVSTVVLLGCLHDAATEGLFLSDSHYFASPLGDLPVSAELNEELGSCSTLFEINDIPHLREHTLEVLLPFVKFCFSQAVIIPILMGSHRAALVSTLARALRIVFEPLMDETLIIASANLSKNADAQSSRSQAEECVRLLESGDAEQFIAHLYQDRISVCGGGVVAALLESGLLAGKPGKLVSGPLVKAIGEENKSVYYGGLAFE
jgi:AmmeMemoRadiSam system protein B